MLPVSELSAAIRWWAVLMILGGMALPLTLVLFGKLPDRGYAFVKLVGVLLVSYLFWILGSLGFIGNNVGGILLSLTGLAGLSAAAYLRRPDAITLGEWFKDNRTQILLTELVFALLFFAWVWVRAQHPSITATEKPMEFAFLNSLGRSPNFPPLDPWLSNYAISYYYFGYVMTSVIARLAFVQEAIAFNLGIAWLVAGTGTAAFGLVYNLVATQGSRRMAFILGLVAALALPVAGNLQIVMEVAHANGIGSAAFWQWLDVRDINQAPNLEQTPRYESSAWWWWRSSRVIHEYHLSGRAEEGLEPIVEFPGFSFILGDMHPHVLALPFAFLSLAVALAWWLGQGKVSPARWAKEGWYSLRNLINWPLWAFTIVVLGGLSFLNTWDVLIHLFILVGAFYLGQWRQYGRHPYLLSQTVLVTLLLTIPAILIYFPFYIGFRSQAGAPYILPMLMQPTRLPHFLIIFGMPLLTIVSLLLVQAGRQHFRYWRSGVGLAAALVAALSVLMLLLGMVIAMSGDSWRVVNLANELSITLPPQAEGGGNVRWALTSITRLVPAVVTARLAHPALTLLLSAMIALVVMGFVAKLTGRENDVVSRATGTSDEVMRGDGDYYASDSLPFVLLLILTGTLLTLGPEFVYLRDNFGMRLNTTFKFYYQAWIFFGVSGIYALHYLWHTLKGGQQVVSAVVTVGYSAAFVLSLLFPFYGVQSRAAEYRGPVASSTRAPATLNGLDFVRRFNPDEYEAVNWLRQEVSDTAVVLEAVGGQYSDYGRISARTGLPTVLGWAGHEYQWRGSDHPEPGPRDTAVQQIYSQPDWNGIDALLNRYGVEYIYVGGLELSTYGQTGLEKFDERLDVAYQNSSVTIYRWYPQS